MVFHQEDWKVPRQDTLKQHLQAIERPQDFDKVRRVRKNPDMTVSSLIHPDLKDPGMALHDPKDLDMNRRRWILTNTVPFVGNNYSAFYFVMKFYS